MKLYIKNFNPLDFNPDKFLQYFQKTGTFTDIYSDVGIYRVEENKIYKLKIIDFPIKELHNKDMCILVDSSYFEKEHVHNIPVTHIYSKIKYNLYRFSKIKLIVEFEKDKISSLYFETENKNIDEDFIYSETIHFLSLVKKNP